MKTVQAEASISSPSLLRSRILSEQSEKKLEESKGTAVDAAIVVGRHVSPLRGKG